MMSQADKLRQSIEAVYLALGQLAAQAEREATSPKRMRITIEHDDEESPWREACDMIAQAREEARNIEGAIRGDLMEQWSAIAPKT